MATEGTSDRSSDDPVLDQAFSEMAAEGGFDATAAIDDLGSTEVTQADGTASAAPAAAPAPATGDDGSGKASTDAKATTSPATGTDGAVVAAADPLAGTEPFRYTVNGQAQSLAWAHRVPGEGVLLTEAEVPHLQQLAERAETLDRATRDLTAQNSTYERLSTWTVTGPDGKEETLTGQKGLEAFHLDHAQALAELGILRDLINNPDKLVGPTGLLMVADGKVTHDPALLEIWNGRLEQARFKASQTTREQIGSVLAPPKANAPSQPSYTSEAPRIIQSAAGAQFDALTADDKAILAAQLDRYVRPVTADDRRWSPEKKIGDPIVDAAFAKVVQHLAAQRHAAKEAAKAAETAGKHNAGMDKGRQPAKQPSKPSTPAVVPKAGERKKADWDSPFSDAMSEMGIPVR